MLGAAGQERAPGVQVNEEEHPDGPQADGLDGKEIARQHAAGLGAQERAPGQARAAWGGWDAVLAEHGADRGRRGHVPELWQFAPKALVAPRRVLSRQPDDQLAEVLPEWRATGAAARPNAAHLGRASSRCQRSNVSGRRGKPGHSEPGSRRLSPARTGRSPGW